MMKKRSVLWLLLGMMALVFTACTKSDGDDYLTNPEALPPSDSNMSNGANGSHDSVLVFSGQLTFDSPFGVADYDGVFLYLTSDTKLVLGTMPYVELFGLTQPEGSLTYSLPEAVPVEFTASLRAKGYSNNMQIWQVQAPELQFETVCDGIHYLVTVAFDSDSELMLNDQYGTATLWLYVAQLLVMSNNAFDVSEFKYEDEARPLLKFQSK